MLSRPILPLFLAFAFAALSLACHASDQPPLELSSPHFTLVTDAGEKQARHILDNLEDMRWMFQTLFPKAEVDPASPIPIIAVKTRRSFGALEPAEYLVKGQLNLAGYFRTSPDKNLILIRLDDALRAVVEKRLAIKDNGGNLCSVASVDLAWDKTSSIVASIDWSGRGLCNEVWVINPAQDHSEDQHFDAWNVQDVKTMIINREALGSALAVPKGYSPYNGAGCVATWTTIYAQNDGKLVDLSEDFLEYYQRRLKKLQGRIIGGAEGAECAQMESDIQRFLGFAPNAGYDRAIQWVQSNDPSLRAKGVVVLGDIGDQASRQELEKVATGDSSEATLARHLLHRDSN